MQQEEKQQSVKQKTLGAFFKTQNPAAAPPPTVLQRVLQDKRASSKLQEARAKGQQLVVLTPEELQQAIEDRAALRGTPGRPRTSQPEKSLVAGLRRKKNNLQRQTLHRLNSRVEESAGTKAVIARSPLWSQWCSLVPEEQTAAGSPACSLSDEGCRGTRIAVHTAALKLSQGLKCWFF